jgi:hypothetical protein
MSRHSTSKWGGREEELPHFRSGSVIDVYHEYPTVPLERGSDDCYVSYKLHTFKDIKYEVSLAVIARKQQACGSFQGVWLHLLYS